MRSSSGYGAAAGWAVGQTVRQDYGLSSGRACVCFPAQNSRAYTHTYTPTHPQDMAVLYEDYQPVDLAIPYLPGFLGFREAAAYKVRGAGRGEAGRYEYHTKGLVRAAGPRGPGGRDAGIPVMALVGGCARASRLGTQWWWLCVGAGTRSPAITRSLLQHLPASPLHALFCAPASQLAVSRDVDGSAAAVVVLTPRCFWSGCGLVRCSWSRRCCWWMAAACCTRARAAAPARCVW